MKTWKPIAALLLALSVTGASAWSRPVDLSAPSGGVGASDLRGYLAIWREIDGVGLQLGKDSYLPLRYKFSSDPNTGGVLGSGFYLPMFEAKNILIREKMMRAFLPCGKGLYLRRDPVDPTKFQTVDLEWTGLLNGDDFTIWRDDGWKILYHLGRLSSITGDDNHEFTWSFNGGIPSGVSEDGRELLSLEYNQAGLLSAVVFDGKRHEMEYGERPLTENLLGQTGVKQLVPALSTWKYPDGKTETFKFELTPDRVPTVTLTDLDLKQTTYAWNAATSYIASEQGPQGDWKYQVGTAPSPLGVPPIIRTDAQGKTEGMAIDSKLGTYTAQAADGTTTVTHVFEAPGPLYNKVKSIEKTTNGVTTIIYKASYDEMGRLIRKVDRKGFIINYIYDDNGKFLKMRVSPPTDPGILATLKQEEEVLLKQLAKVSNPVERGDLLEELAFLYIHDFGMPAKGLALLPQITDRKQAFNVQMHAIDGDDTLTGQQKAEKFKVLEQQYPEQKHLLNLLIAARTRDDLMNARALNRQ